MLAHLEEDCSLTMFAENKGFSSFVFYFTFKDQENSGIQLCTH